MYLSKLNSQKHEKRIEYFGMSESQDTHDVITNVLLECVMQSIEEMVCNIHAVPLCAPDMYVHIANLILVMVNLCIYSD